MFLLTLKPSLSTIKPPHIGAERIPQHVYKALDAGGGIGRVTEAVLLPLCPRVDLVESSAHFLTAAKKSSPSWPGISSQTKGVRYFQCGMQDFDPARLPPEFTSASGATSDFDGPYDVVWMQWAAGHLSDDQLVAFLVRMKAALRENTEEPSLIVLKENVVKTEKSMFDETDSTLVR